MRSLDRQAPLPDDATLEDAPLPDDPRPADEAPLPLERGAPSAFPPAAEDAVDRAAHQVPVEDEFTIPEAPGEEPDDASKLPYMTPPPDEVVPPADRLETIAPGELDSVDWLAGGVGFSGPCADDCCDSCCDPCRGMPSYRLYFIGEALFLNLSRPGYRALADEGPTGESTSAAATVLSTRNLDPGNGVGPRFRLGWLFGPRSSVELSYFGLNYWNATNEASAPGALSLPGPLASQIPGFSATDQITAGYAATIQNAEANYLHRLGMSNLQVLFGFRWLGFNEKLNLRAYSPMVSNDYSINARNQLFGLQCGSRYLVQFWRIGLEGVCKAGLYGNDSLQRTQIGPGNEVWSWLRTDRSGGNLAFVGELGLSGIAQVTNWLYVRGGYNLFWLQGIARAPDQLALTTSPGSTVESAQAGALVHNRGAFLHGASVGCEVRW